MTRYLTIAALLILSGCARYHTVGQVAPPDRPTGRPLKAHAAPAGIIEAIIRVESGGDPAAVSRSGAVGLMQIIPSTGRMLGYSREDLRDPKKNVAAGRAYLNSLLKQFGGDLTKALAAYNCGPARYHKCLGYAHKVISLAKGGSHGHKRRALRKRSH